DHLLDRASNIPSGPHVLHRGLPSRIGLDQSNWRVRAAESRGEIALRTLRRPQKHGATAQWRSGGERDMLENTADAFETENWLFANGNAPAGQPRDLIVRQFRAAIRAQRHVGAPAAH